MIIRRLTITFLMWSNELFITGFVTRLTRRVLLVGQELLTISEHMSSPPVFSGIRSCYSVFSFMCKFCRSLFVLLSYFFWPLCCLFFFDIRILITSLWYLQTLLVQRDNLNTNQRQKHIGKSYEQEQF